MLQHPLLIIEDYDYVSVITVGIRLIMCVSAMGTSICGKLSSAPSSKYKKRVMHNVIIINLVAIDFRLCDATISSAERSIPPEAHYPPKTKYRVQSGICSNSRGNCKSELIFPTAKCYSLSATSR